MHLKKQPNSCFDNNYFDVGFRAWQVNTNIQPVFNDYKPVTCMCQYFSKTEDQCSQAMKQPAKEAFCRRDSLPYFARIEAKENLSGCLFVNANPQ